METALPRFLVIIALSIGFSLLAFAPPNITAGILGFKEKSPLWGKLIGFLGLVWLLMGLIPPEIISSAGLRQFLPSLRMFLGGIVVGLFVAVLTKRFERKS
jgi:hypothetical protein